MLEETLNTLFDFQRIAQNSRLARLIDEAERPAVFKLSDEEMQMVAGGTGLLEQLSNPENDPFFSLPRM